MGICSKENPAETPIGIGEVTSRDYNPDVIKSAKIKLEASSKRRGIRFPRKVEVVADEELLEDTFDELFEGIVEDQENLGELAEEIEEFGEEIKEFYKHPVEYIKNSHPVEYIKKKASNAKKRTLEEFSIFKEKPIKYLALRAPKLILRAILGLALLSPAILGTIFTMTVVLSPFAPMLFGLQGLVTSLVPFISLFPTAVGYVVSKIPKKETIGAGVGIGVSLVLGLPMVPLAIAGALAVGLNRAHKIV